MNHLGYENQLCVSGGCVAIAPVDSKKLVKILRMSATVVTVT